MKSLKIKLILIVVIILSVVYQTHQYQQQTGIISNPLTVGSNCQTPVGINQDCQNLNEARLASNPIEAKKILCRTLLVRAAFLEANDPCE